MAFNGMVTNSEFRTWSGSKRRKYSLFCKEMFGSFKLVDMTEHQAEVRGCPRPSQAPHCRSRSPRKTPRPGRTSRRGGTRFVSAHGDLRQPPGDDLHHQRRVIRRRHQHGNSQPVHQKVNIPNGYMHGWAGAGLLDGPPETLVNPTPFVPSRDSKCPRAGAPRGCW